MAVEYRTWENSPAEQSKFAAWIERINSGHAGVTHLRNEQLNWTPAVKPLAQSVIGLFTTGGVHHRNDVAFDVADPHGDCSFREIPADIDTADLTITHTHYNHVDADRDINCMFPLERLRELRDEGVIGAIAPVSYSMMGFNPDPRELAKTTAPELARRFADSGIDRLFMTCG